MASVSAAIIADIDDMLAVAYLLSRARLGLSQGVHVAGGVDDDLADPCWLVSVATAAGDRDAMGQVRSAVTRWLAWAAPLAVTSCDRTADVVRDPGNAVTGDAAPCPVIPNTDVCDSPEDRAVIQLCERYRHAYEERDGTALLALADARYHDPTHASRDALATELAQRFASVESVGFEARYHTVTLDPRGDTATVLFTRFLSIARTGAGRELRVDDVSVVLVRQGTTWAIQAGM
jgi:hypothetical protein